MINKQYADRKKGRKRYYTFSTRLNYEDRNRFLKYCKNANLTPSEVIRDIIYDRIKIFDINLYICQKCGFEFLDGRKINEGEHICLTANIIKSQILEIIKSYSEKGISKELIFQLLKKCQENKDLTLKEFEGEIKKLFEDGEIYENKPNSIKWLG